MKNIIEEDFENILYIHCSISYLCIQVQYIVLLVKEFVCSFDNVLYFNWYAFTSDCNYNSNGASLILIIYLCWLIFRMTYLWK